MARSLSPLFAWNKRDMIYYRSFKKDVLAMKTARSRIISMLLAAVMVLGTLTPVFAEGEAAPDNSTGTVASEVAAAQETTAAAPETIKTAKRLRVSGIDAAFKSAVVSSVFLGSNCSPRNLVTSAYKKKIKLTWGSASNSAGIDGYIILRKDLKGSRYSEIARVGRTVTSYTDTKAKTKNKFYQYNVVAYKKVSGKVRISGTTGWAGSVTTRSKKKNVNSLTFTNLASVAAIMKGRSITVKVTFPKKAYSKSIRWSSSNSNVASVDSSGRITAKNIGTATIYARTHTGKMISIKVTVFKGGDAQSMVQVMRSWMDYSYTNGKHKSIVDIYNSMYPLPAGYKMKYWDAWCDCTVSAAAIVTGNAEKTGRECSVPRHIKIFKSLGIWLEGNNTVPQPGDLIVFNWFPAVKNNASHIGIVEKVEGNTITTIEGNMGIGKVGRRTIPVGWKYIRGYARPVYTPLPAPDPVDPDDTEDSDETGDAESGDDPE